MQPHVLRANANLKSFAAKYLATLIHLSFIDPQRVGFGEIFPEVMIFPEGNIITEKIELHRG